MKNSNQINQTKQAALQYISMGLYPIPDEYQSKETYHKGWMDLRITSQQDVDSHFSTPRNISLLMGCQNNDHGQLVCVDLDDMDACLVAEKYLPPTHLVGGRLSMSKAHWFYSIPNGTLENRAYKGKNGKVLFEIKAKGKITVAPSIYPTDPAKGHLDIEPCVWEELNPPSVIAAEELLQALDKLAEHLGLVDKRITAEKPTEKPQLVLGEEDPVVIEYLTQAEPAISGKGGHPTALSVVDKMFYRFSMTDEEALNYLKKYYNPRCDPPWSDIELIHKIQEARKYVDKNSAYPYPMTDVGNSRLFVDTFKDNIRYVAEWKCWMAWNGKYWEKGNEKIHELGKGMGRIIRAMGEKDNDSEKRSKIVKWSLDCEQERSIESMIRLARSDRRIFMALEKHNPFDSRHELFNVSNGTINLDTGQLQPHNREDFLTKLSTKHYEESQVDCPLFTEFLNLIFQSNAELIEYVQRIAGYSLSGFSGDDCLFILYGDGRNGKTTFVNTLMGIMGEYAGVVDNKVLVYDRHGKTNSDEEADLFGLRLASCSETERNDYLAESKVKRLTGNRRIKAMRKYEHAFEFDTTHKIWLDTNNKPSFRGQDEGIKSRFILIPFTYTIPVTNRVQNYFQVLLEKEASGILAWMMAGYRRWKELGILNHQPKQVSEATNEYITENDSIQQFLDECCQKDPAKRSDFQWLFEKYQKWCGENNVVSCKKKPFSQSLRIKGYTVERVNLRSDFKPTMVKGLVIEGNYGNAGDTPNMLNLQAIIN